MQDFMQTAHTLSPIEPEKLADALIGSMTSLTRVMDEEIDLLKKRDYAAMNAVRQQKVRLLRDYSIQHQSLALNPEALKFAPQVKRIRLRTVADGFAQATARNTSELKAAVVATQSLLQTIMDAARKENKGSDCYVDTRKDPFLSGSYSPICSPVAVSRVV